MEPMTMVALASLAYTLGDWAYHRYIVEQPGKKRPEREIQIPRVDAGAPIPLVFGRARVRQPVLAWTGPIVWDLTDELYRMDCFYLIGLGMNDGSADNAIHNAWVGEKKFLGVGTSPPEWSTLTGDGGFEAPVTCAVDSDNDYVGGNVEFLNGNTTQTLASDASTATNYTGQRMIAGGLGGDAIPGYRGYLSAMCFHINSDFKWFLGKGTTVPAISFEVSSYVTDSGYPGVGVYGRIGQDSNPANVLWDILKCSRGKLGINPTSYLDAVSFGEAATKLYGESFGISGVIEDTRDAQDHVLEILKCIDGVMYERPSDGKLCLGLVRADYVAADLPEINKDNCSDIVNLAMGSMTNLVNRVRVIYKNRDRDYIDDEEIAENTSSQVGNRINEVVINMPWVTHSALAKRLAARELAFRSRPIIKCRALVDRSFIRRNPGDAVRVVWNTPDLAGIVFRIGATDRGTLEDGRIALDLISDASYVYRATVPAKAPHYGVSGIQDLGLR